MKKYFIGLLAVVLVIGASAFITAKQGHLKQTKNNLAIYYYRFDGTSGQESNMSLWTQLADVSAYDALSCPAGSSVGCKIQNTTNSAGHPTSVPLSPSGVPEQAGVNVEVVNKN